MRQVIYSRVSTDRQETANQLHVLRREFPDAEIVEETGSGLKHRPRLAELTATLSEGDELIVYSLDRLGRSTVEVLALLASLDKKGVILRSKREGVDLSTPSGRFMMRVMASFAELERDLISERTKTALAAKRASGVRLGRPPKVLKSDTISSVKEMREAGATIRQIADATGLPKTNVCRLLKTA